MNCKLYHNRGFRVLLISIALIVCGWVSIAVSGCGKRESISSAAGSASTGPTAKAPAAGPAITEKLSFDQLALDSPVKRIKTKQGPTYLEFTYTDRDGKVYRCQLPEAMAKGSYLPDEWIRTFAAYRLPKVIKQKAAPKSPLVKAVRDFPFISPRPTPEQTSTEQPPARQPEAPAPPMPTAPPTPTPHSSGVGRSDLD